MRQEFEQKLKDLIGNIAKVHANKYDDNEIMHLNKIIHNLELERHVTVASPVVVSAEMGERVVTIEEKLLKHSEAISRMQQALAIKQSKQESSMFKRPTLITN